LASVTGAARGLPSLFTPAPDPLAGRLEIGPDAARSVSRSQNARRA
jgi:hypothetical protein